MPDRLDDALTRLADQRRRWTQTEEAARAGAALESTSGQMSAALPATDMNWRF